MAHGKYVINACVGNKHILPGICTLINGMINMPKYHTVISRVRAIKFLGIIIDENLTWKIRDKAFETQKFNTRPYDNIFVNASTVASVLLVSISSTSCIIIVNIYRETFQCISNVSKV